MVTTTVVSSDTLSVDLNKLLKLEISLSGQLLEFISTEKKQLELPHSDEAQDTIQRKLTLLQQLQDVSGQRQDLMLKHGYESTPQGIEFCSLACAHAPDIRQSFSKLSELARNCHAENKMLGQILNRKSGFFNRLLANLSDSGHASLYQANGMKDSAATKQRTRLSV